MLLALVAPDFAYAPVVAVITLLAKVDGKRAGDIQHLHPKSPDYDADPRVRMWGWLDDVMNPHFRTDTKYFDINRCIERLLGSGVELLSVQSYDKRLLGEALTDFVRYREQLGS